MKVNKIKEILKNKKIMTISGAVAGALIITVAGTMILHNRNKVEDKKQEAAIVVEDNTLDKQVKDQLEQLRKIGIEKLSEEDKKLIDQQIKSIEELVKNKEYDKAKKEIEIVNKDIDNKLKEIAKKDEKPKEEKATEEKEENKEVASNTTENSTSNDGTSSNNTSNSSGSNNEYVAPPVVEQPSEPSYTPPVVEEPVQPTPPQVEPAPQPPVVETPSYPSVAEVQQRLISYGQSLGLTYDPSINSGTEGTVMQGTDQMWDLEMGNSGVCRRLLDGLKSSGCYAFNVEVVDLGNGFCRMDAYGLINWD